MTLQEFTELHEYIMKNHSWKDFYENASAGRKLVKYVDFCVDTRKGDIWCVKLRQSGTIKTFEGTNIKEKVINFLKEEHKCPECQKED